MCLRLAIYRHIRIRQLIINQTVLLYIYILRVLKEELLSFISLIEGCDYILMGLYLLYYKRLVI